MKRTFIYCLSLILIFVTISEYKTKANEQAITALYDSSIKITVNDRARDLTSPIVMINNKAHVYLKDAAEILDFEVLWDNANTKIFMSPSPDEHISLPPTPIQGSLEKGNLFTYIGTDFSKQTLPNRNEPKVDGINEQADFDTYVDYMRIYGSFIYFIEAQPNEPCKTPKEAAEIAGEYIRFKDWPEEKQTYEVSYDMKNNIWIVSIILDRTGSDTFYWFPPICATVSSETGEVRVYSN